MELVKLTCPPFKNPSHSQQFEIVSLVDDEYIDKYFTTWTYIWIHEQVLLLEKTQSIIFAGVLGRKKYQHLLCPGIIINRDQQWRFRTFETMAWEAFGLCTVWDVCGLPPWKVVLEEASFESFLSILETRMEIGKSNFIQRSLYLYKSESFKTLRLTGYAQSRIKHKGFGKGRQFEAFHGKNN